MKPFIETYQELKTRRSQKIMRERVIEACEISPKTFYSWLRRGSVPEGKHQERIAELYGVPIEFYFPVPKEQPDEPT